MNTVPYSLISNADRHLPMGLIVLQSDETLEPEFKRYFADDPAPMYINRIPSGLVVTPDSLSDMKAHIPAAADLLPKAMPFSVVGYGCTSASAIIGHDMVADLVRSTCDTREVTNPLRAAIACAKAKGVSKLALLSPYTEDVNEPLRAAFSNGGLSTDVFGTFDEPEEARVVRVTKESVVEGACELGSDPSVEAVFLSCTNLPTIDAIPEIEQRIGKPVLSSNQSLAWHMKVLAAQPI